jgi:hypothetical protein
VLNALDINITKKFLIERVAVLHQNGEGGNPLSQKDFIGFRSALMSFRKVHSKIKKPPPVALGW